MHEALVLPDDQSRSVHIHYYLPAGSASEPERLAGISHMLEHLVFKGTRSMNGRAIGRTIDRLGGDLNAYTTKDYTVFSARVLPADALDALDLIQSMVHAPTLEAGDLKVERQVVQSELELYAETPEDVVADWLEALLWPESGYARPVAGYRDTVAAMRHEDLLQWHQRTYLEGSHLLAVAGQIQPLVESGHIAPCAPLLMRCDAGVAPEGSGEHLENRADGPLHVAIGGAGPHLDHPQLAIADILCALLGAGVSSRLFSKLREDEGLSYGITASMIPYGERGLWTIESDLDPRRSQHALDLIRMTLDDLAALGPTEEEVERVKAQLTRSFLLSQESPGARAERAGYFALLCGHVPTEEETLARLNAVQPEDVRTMACDWFGPDRLSIAAIGPRAGKLRLRR